MGDDHLRDTTRPDEIDRADGQMSFGSYSLEQLHDLKDVLDRLRYPENYRNLLEEMTRREVSSSLEHEDIRRGRFTSAAGIRGWYQAKLARSPFYGSGSIEVGRTEIVLGGWQRSWLGAPLESSESRALDGVRNVAQDGAVVHFELTRSYFPPQRVRFATESPDAASQLVATLPTVTTSGFLHRWTAVRDFHRKLLLLGGPPRLTAAIVAVNCIVFAAMSISAKTFGQFGLPALWAWGANFGPLTVNGQWWRLICALFVHFNLAHLALNMWALWNIGRLSERLFGRGTFVVLYVASGLLAGLTSIAWDPSLSTVGASGAVFGVFGAFLAFMVRRRQDIPPTVLRQHWFSTSVFVIFNLVSGAVRPGIDNAAHIGGLLSGCVLGYLLARPLDPILRTRVPAGQALAAAAFVTIASAAAVWQVKGVGSGMTVSERYFRNHPAYVEGEAANLRLWNTLAGGATAGSISDAELAVRMERDIVPFWRDQKAQLARDNSALKGPDRDFGLLVARFADLRYRWATAVVETLRRPDHSGMADVNKLRLRTTLANADIARIELRSHMEHRPRALAATAFFTKVRQLLIGYHSTCVEAPAGWVPKLGNSDDPKDGPSERHALACRAQELFMVGDYERLESLMDHSLRSLENLPDGSSRLEALAGGLSNLFAYGGLDAEGVLGHTADWRREIKGSVAAELVEAMVLSEWAWAARGHGGADSVSPQGMALFEYRSEMAHAALAEIAPEASAHPLWFAESLQVGLDQAKSADELRTLFNQGVARAPSYRPLYRQMLRILMPRWGGSYDDVDQFINQVRTTAADGRGYEHYALLYSEYAAMEGDDIDFFRETRAFWSGMQTGFRGLVRRYPASDYWMNRFAHFACRARDPDEYARLRDGVGKRFSATAWTAKYSLESCDKIVAGLPGAQHASRAAPDDDAIGSTQIREFGGIRLGMSQADLLKVKGVPIRQEDTYWVYNSVDARHNGALTVFFSIAGRDPEAIVQAVEYMGDSESQPAELPDLLDWSSVRVIQRYGPQIDGRLTLRGNMRFQFKNGLYVDTVDERVRRYGIFIVPSTKKDAPALSGRP